MGWDRERVRRQGGLATALEISHQPDMWKKVQALVADQRAALEAFLTPLLEEPDLRIILTGAGTSAFIGQCLAPQMSQRLGVRVEAIPTTDLVSGPAQCFRAGIPTLLVSFARSGGSPESVAAVALANRFVDKVSHLLVTCNANGKLYQRGRKQANAFVLLLPDETHDRGFAMTSSFTSMLLAAACIFGVVDGSAANIAAIRSAASGVQCDALPLVDALVARKFSRVIYLGSNELKGLAQEAALKLLELSDGQVVAFHDSPLGFRHGPKTIVDSDTLIIFFLSNDAYTRRYELDLLHELRADGQARQVLALSADNGLDGAADWVLSNQVAKANPVELALPFAVFAQMFAFLQSLALGLSPDKPSVSGTVNRVVSGVTIYPLQDETADVSGG